MARSRPGGGSNFAASTYPAPSPAGATGGYGYIGKVPFSFASASPIVLQSVPAGLVLLRAAVLVQVHFDGAGPSLSLGTSADPSLVFSPGDVDLAAAGDTFDDSSLFEFAAPDLLLLTLSVPGATQGEGILVYTVR